MQCKYPQYSEQSPFVKKDSIEDISVICLIQIVLVWFLFFKLLSASELTIEICTESAFYASSGAANLSKSICDRIKMIDGPYLPRRSLFDELWHRLQPLCIT